MVRAAIRYAYGLWQTVKHGEGGHQVSVEVRVRVLWSTVESLGQTAKHGEGGHEVWLWFMGYGYG